MRSELVPGGSRPPGSSVLCRLGMLGAAATILFTAPPTFAQSLAERLVSCMACHGENGTSQIPEVPSLGGQPASFLLIQLYQFREKQRLAEPMNELTKAFSDEDLRLFSEEIAKLPPPASPPDIGESARLNRGRAVVQQHRCGFCHNPDMSGHDHIPRIGAQREDYLIKVMREYKSGARTGYDPAMIDVAKGVADDEIADLAHYLAYWR